MYESVKASSDQNTCLRAVGAHMRGLLWMAALSVMHGPAVGCAMKRLFLG